jgi:hypothetical protein
MAGMIPMPLMAPVPGLEEGMGGAGEALALGDGGAGGGGSGRRANSYGSTTPFSEEETRAMIRLRQDMQPMFQV